jgi:predicted amidophosphoribosyltransferase
MGDESLRCPACGATVSVEADTCPACRGELPLPDGVPAIAITEPWFRNPMVRLAFVAVAAILIAVVVILMDPG